VSEREKKFFFFFGKKNHVDVFDAGRHSNDNGLNTLLKNHHNAMYIHECYCYCCCCLPSTTEYSVESERKKEKSRVRRARMNY
jgi:hypothetical protein